MNSAPFGKPQELITTGNGQARLQLMDRLGEELTSLGWSATDVYGVQAAMEEAVSNAYRHGNQHGKLGDVDIRWHATKSEFEIEISDRGDGFVESTVPDPTALENLESFSGRGLLLMRNYMNEVSYRNGGRTVVMRKQSAEVGESEAR